MSEARHNEPPTGLKGGFSFENTSLTAYTLDKRALIEAPVGGRALSRMLDHDRALDLGGGRPLRYLSCNDVGLVVVILLVLCFQPRKLTRVFLALYTSLTKYSSGLLVFFDS